MAKQILDFDKLESLRKKLGFKDPGIFKKSIYAFNLLSDVLKVYPNLVFKGGTSILLHVFPPVRLSIDIDILLPLSERDGLLQKLERAAQDSEWFDGVQENPRSGKKIPKAHFKFPFTSQFSKVPQYVLLDVVFTESPYGKLLRKDIAANPMAFAGGKGIVSVPSVEGLFGDKLTTISPKTVGIPLSEDWAIVSLGELPSQTMITVLTIFFYYHKKALTKKQAIELRKWFWRSSLANRYIGSGYSQNISVDAKKMRDLAQHNKELNIPKASTKVFAKVKGVDIRAGRSTYRNIIKQALWQQTPIFINGEKVSRDDVESGQHKPEDDHSFPYDLYRKGIAGQEINNILNIHFLNGDENSRKRHRLPSEWLLERIKDIGVDRSGVEEYFASQLLPFKTINDVRRFERAFKIKSIRTRQRKFVRSYQSFLWRRFKLFERALDRLQNGRLK